MKELVLSRMGHTWILDLDGTLVKHNGYRSVGEDTFLKGAKEFLDSIPKGDMVIFLTSRMKEYGEATENFLDKNGIQYDYIIYDAPYGERILLNDDKPSGLKMAKAISVERDCFLGMEIVIDQTL